MKDKYIFIGLLIFTFSMGFGYAIGASKPVEVVKETQYILKECKTSEIEWLRYYLEKEKLMHEFCPNGGQWTGDNLTKPRCFNN